MTHQQRVPSIPKPPDHPDDWYSIQRWMQAVTQHINMHDGLGKNVQDLKPTVEQLIDAGVTNADKIKGRSE